MSIMFEEIIKQGIEAVSHRNNIDFRVDNIILGKSIYTMNHSNVVFTDMNLCLILLEKGYGFSYFQSEIDYKIAETYVNQDLRKLLYTSIPQYMKVALTDALYSLQNNHGHKYNYFSGNLRNKAKKRAIKIVEDIPEHSKVTLLGASSEIIEQCANKHIQLSVLDLEQSKIGLEFNKHIIEDGEKVLIDKLKNSDYVIATGMIFVSDTADQLFELSQQFGFKLILYMESGSNFGKILLKYGAYKILSETFPYYDFNGKKKYAVYKKKGNL